MPHLKNAPRRLLGLFGRALPLAAYPLLVRRPAVGVCYHVVSEKPLPHVRHLYSHKTPDEFERDMLFFKRRFRPVSYEDLLAHYDGSRRLPKNAVLITFDDGYAECWTHVRPILLKYQIPCIFFVATDFVNNRRLFYRNKVSLCVERLSSLDNTCLKELSGPLAHLLRPYLRNGDAYSEALNTMNLDKEATIDRACDLLDVDVDSFLVSQRPYLLLEQIEGLCADGFTIGAHSLSHARLSHVDEDRLAEEIVGSCRIVREWTGQRYVPFAFPYSANGVDRGFCQNLVGKHKYIRLLFGSGGLKRDSWGIYNRLGFDKPGAEAGMDVATRLHRAYEKALVEELRGIARRWRRSTDLHNPRCREP